MPIEILFRETMQRSSFAHKYIAFMSQNSLRALILGNKKGAT